MATKSILGRLAAICAAALLSSCSSTPWKLASEGYSINVLPYGNEFTMAVHLNQVKALGGDIDNARFQLFVSQRLKWDGVCANGWEPLECIDAVTCTERRSNSVIVVGRCLPS